MSARFHAAPASLQLAGGKEIVVWVVIDRQGDFLHQIYRSILSAEKQAAFMERFHSHG